MHLADTFIQSNLQCSQAIIFFVSMRVPWELNPQPFALLTQCSTTETQEHITTLIPPPYKSRSAFPSVNHAPGGCPSAEMFTLVEFEFPPRGPPLPSFGPQNRPKPPHPPYGAPDIYIHIHTQNALHKYWNSKDKIALFAVDSESLK